MPGTCEESGRLGAGLGRTAEIAKVLSKYGLDWLANSHSPWRIVALPKAIFTRKDHRSQPERVRLALEELGTTYIKLGQAISTRSDLVPANYVKELAKLQDHAPTIPYSDVVQVIQDEFGKTVEELFTMFEVEPMAAASIGQVHRAMLRDGTLAVVKVQRPGVEETVQRDMEVLKDVARLVQGTLPPEYDLDGSLEEFGFTLRNELDYRREGRNADRFRDNFGCDPTLRIPKVHWNLSTKRVLTMERLEGTKVSDVAELESMGVDRTELARECARVVLTQIFEHGFFHADPHPGNLFVLQDGRVALLDFGMIGRLDLPTRESVMRLTIGIGRQDAEAVMEELLILGVAHQPVERQDMKMDLRRVMQNHLELPPREFSFAQMYNDILSTAAQHHIRLQSDLLFLARTIAMCEGLSDTLDKDFSLVDFARDYLEKLYMETRSPVALVERAQEGYIDAAELVVDLPRRTRRLLGQLERGEIQLTAKMADERQLLEHFHRAFNRLSMSVLIAGLVAGLSVLTLTLSPGDRAGFANVGVKLMLVFVMLGGAGLLMAIWRSRHA